MATITGSKIIFFTFILFKDFITALITLAEWSIPILIASGLISFEDKDSLSTIGDELRPGIVHRIDKNTSGLVIIAKWGDEGKGKIVDWLSEQADIVIRFQGGHNAGHTLVIDGVTYKLRLLPSGIVRKNKVSIIGNGVVVDPWALLEEIEEIKSKGVDVNINNFIISEAANLILPFHREMDEIREDAAGKSKIGTTRRGIGPAYEDKVGRRSIRVMDLRSEKNLDQRLEAVLVHHNAIRKGLGKKIFEKEQLKSDLLKIAPKILQFSQPVWLKIDEFKKQKKRILFEGAQGILLDVDHGTYPYVTSSNTVAKKKHSL